MVEHDIVPYQRNRALCDQVRLRERLEMNSEPIELQVEQRGGGGREEALEDGCYNAVWLQTKLESTAIAPLSPFVDLLVVLLCFVWLN